MRERERERGRGRERKRERQYRVSYNLVFTLDSYLNPRGSNPRLATSLKKGSLSINQSINQTSQSINHPSPNQSIYPSIHPSPQPITTQPPPLTNPPNPISSPLTPHKHPPHSPPAKSHTQKLPRQHPLQPKHFSNYILPSYIPDNTSAHNDNIPEWNSLHWEILLRGRMCRFGGRSCGRSRIGECPVMKKKKKGVS